MNAQEITTALAPLTHKLGQGAEVMYQAYYREAIIDGFVDLLWALALVTSMAFCWRRFIKPMYDDYKEGSSDGLGLVLSVFALIIGSFMALYCLSDAVSNFANPQYNAITHIIGDLKPND